jgi:hypothetical protein
LELLEIFKDSRRISLSATTFTRRFVYNICLSQDEYDLIPDGVEASEIFGKEDDIYIVSLVSETFPEIIEVEGLSGDTIPLVLDNVDISQVGDLMWRVELEYALPSAQQESADYVRLSFQIRTNQTNRKQSISVRNSTSRTGYAIATPPNPYRAIGFSDGQIEGADVFTGEQSFSLTKYYDPSLWLGSLIPTWGALVPCYNNDVFYGCSAGEVLFLGAQGDGSLYSKIPVTFDFLFSPNKNAVADEGFPALTALGHDIIDYRFEEAINLTTNDTVRYPTYRYVHQMYLPASFSALGV